MPGPGGGGLGSPHRWLGTPVHRLRVCRNSQLFNHKNRHVERLDICQEAGMGTASLDSLELGTFIVE